MKKNFISYIWGQKDFIENVLRPLFDKWLIDRQFLPFIGNSSYFLYILSLQQLTKIQFFFRVGLEPYVSCLKKSIKTRDFKSVNKFRVIIVSKIRYRTETIFHHMKSEINWIANWFLAYPVVIGPIISQQCFLMEKKPFIHTLSIKRAWCFHKQIYFIYNPTL